MTPEIEERFRSLENCQPFQLANYSGAICCAKAQRSSTSEKIPETQQR